MIQLDRSFIHQEKQDRINRNLLDRDLYDDQMKKQSAYMKRQMNRAQMTALSPMEEMKVAQVELQANEETINVNQEKNIEIRKIETVENKATFQDMILVKIFVDKLKKNVSIRRNTISSLNGTNKNMDRMSANEILSYVERAKHRFEKMKKKHVQSKIAEIPWYIVLPTGKFRLFWDIICVIFISYNAFVIPLHISFGGGPRNHLSSEFYNYADTMIDIFFYFDLVLNFITGYEEESKIIFDRNKIAKRYLFSWFIIDFLSIIPFGRIITNVEWDVIRLHKMLKLFRLFRLFRLFGILRIFNRLEYALLLRSTISKLFRFIFLVCFTAHWFSCIFYYLSISSESNINQGWVAYHNLQNADVSEQYIASFYWAIMTMTTVGFGDVGPKSTNERIFVICAMLIGAFIFAFGVTNVVAMVVNLNISESNFRKKMDKVNTYMQARELPFKLRGEIREFFYNSRRLNETNIEKESKILSELSALLRSKVALTINDSFLHKMPIFEGADKSFLLELALSMRMVCFSPLEDVIIEGEIGEEMFFIVRGAVEVLKGDKKLNVLTENQYFGEMAILTQDCRRRATIRTLCFCELRMLTREKFLFALSHYPSVKNRIAELVQDRMKALNGETITIPVTNESTDYPPEIIIKKNLSYKKSSVIPLPDNNIKLSPISTSATNMYPNNNNNNNNNNNQLNQINIPKKSILLSNVQNQTIMKSLDNISTKSYSNSTIKDENVFNNEYKTNSNEIFNRNLQNSYNMKSSISSDTLVDLISQIQIISNNEMNILFELNELEEKIKKITTDSTVPKS